MKTVACLCADLETNGLGLPSRLLEPFRGEALLLRVLKRALTCPALERVLVAAHPRDIPRLKALPLPERCELLPCDAPDVPQRSWLRRSRKWAIDGWRGGIGWSSFFDEEGPPAWLWEACKASKADALVKLPSHAPFLDPKLLADLVALHLQRRNTFQFTFCQAPPGLAAEAFHPEFLETMTKGNYTPRHVLMVRRDQEGMDPQRNECHLDAGERIRNAAFRVTCESPRLWRFCEGIPDGMDAEGIVRHLGAHPASWRGSLPREILSDCLDPEVLGRLAGEAQAEGDTAITLGVRSDPLADPRWQEALAACRPFHGVHLRTRGTGIGAAPVLMGGSGVDVITVVLDALKPETYRSIHGHDGLARATECLERLLAEQKRLGTAAPLLCAEFSVRAENEGELPEWWKAWFGKVDWPLVRGAGEASALHLAPPRRRACVKLDRMLYVAPDGVLHPCAEGEGPLSARGLGEAWASLEPLCSAHARGDYPATSPPCAACREWAWV